MLQVNPSATASVHPPVDPSVAKAREWIAAARQHGVVLAPVRSLKGARTIIAQFDGPRTLELYRCRPVVDSSVLYDVLCADFGIDPDDPDLSGKVDAHFASQQVLA